MKRKLMAFFMACLMVLTIVQGLTLPVMAAGLTLSQLMAKFPSGKYWNGGNPDKYTTTPCKHVQAGEKCANPNMFDGCSQCHGFAQKLFFDAYGSHANDTKMVYDLNSLKAGDVVRYYYKTWEHTIFVTNVSGNTITYAECNGENGLTCDIRWGQTASKSSINLHYVWSAPFALGTTQKPINPANISEGTYVLQSKLNTSKVLNVYVEGSPVAGKIVTIYPYDTKDPCQKWKIVKNGDYYTLTAGTTARLNVHWDGYNAPSGETVNTYSPNTADPDQDWYFVKYSQQFNGTDAYYIVSKSNQNLVLTATVDNNTAQLQVKTKVEGSLNQLWRLIAV